MPSRRDFLLSAGTALITAQAGSAQTPPAANPPAYSLPSLPYAADALEPYIDAQTMTIHHDKHHKAYVDNLNKALAGHPELTAKPIDQLVAELNTVPEAMRTAVRNQGGGHANHSLFWTTLKKNGGGKPKGELHGAMEKTFGSFNAFQDQFTKAALGQFGSGWAWLTTDMAGTLKVEATPNQDSVLSQGRSPVFGIDVWEHAYYLKYQNRRPEYVAAFYNVIDWDAVSDRYNTLRKKM
jgi:Fe-Mn family superoxide dismutase